LFFDSLALALDSNIILYTTRLKSWGFFLTTTEFAEIILLFPLRSLRLCGKSLCFGYGVWPSQ